MPKGSAVARVSIFAGICGFTTEVEATSEDRRHVTLRVESDCPDVGRIAKALNRETFDAFQEIGPCQRRPGESGVYGRRLMRTCDGLPHVACPVPAGICKAIEVAAGLALPRDAHIKVLPEKKEGYPEEG